MKKLIVSFLLSVIAVGCASNHSVMKGSVALKLDDSKGIACLFGENPAPGDEITLFKNDCTENTGKEGSAKCKLVKAGTGKISKMLNDHYAEFEVDSGVQFAEGSIVQLTK